MARSSWRFQYEGKRHAASTQERFQTGVWNLGMLQSTLKHNTPRFVFIHWQHVFPLNTVSLNRRSRITRQSWKMWLWRMVYKLSPSVKVVQEELLISIMNKCFPMQSRSRKKHFRFANHAFWLEENLSSSEFMLSSLWREVAWGGQESLWCR